MEIVLSLAATQHIALTMNERALKGTEMHIDTFSTRSLFTRAAVSKTDPMMFELSEDQLRAIDMLLTDGDPREAKMPDGHPVMELVELVWEALNHA